MPLDDTFFMRRAVELSRRSMEMGGGPFGAVVVADGQIIGEGSNQVIAQCDPTAHAEIVAIRRACEVLQSHDLSGSVIYSSCEPCPMCLAAIWWSRIDQVVYGNTRHDAAVIGFDDEAIYHELNRPVEARHLPLRQFGREEAITVFEQWESLPNRLIY